MSSTCDRNETVIVVHPGRMGGEPTIGHSRLPAEMIARTYWQLGFDEVLRMWDYLDKDDVLIACWFQARFGTRSQRARWKDWLSGADMALWSGDFSTVELPPTEKALV